MSYIGNSPTTTAFVTDTFSGNGSTTAFTMSVAPAATSAVLVAISGVLQDPSTYSVAGTTLTFSAAPPSGTGNISARYLGIPASGVATTAYRTLTEFTATSGQTTFSVPSYIAGFIAVYRNGAMLGTADYTATNGTTVVLAVGAVAGDLIAIESFYVSSVLNAIPNTAGAVQASNLAAGAARANFGAGAVLQVVGNSGLGGGSGTNTSFVATGLTASITTTAANSKILASFSYSLQSNSGGMGALTSIRSSADSYTADLATQLTFSYNGSWMETAGTPILLHSPNVPAGTTLTYKVYAKTSSGTWYINDSWGFVSPGLTWTATLSEIAA